ncbi:MAG: hypothetical protein H7288_17230 [Kineosporiaceae bacterium]|nr:hypothetical protein [Aeromicrobium sp.]
MLRAIAEAERTLLDAEARRSYDGGLHPQDGGGLDSAEYKFPGGAISAKLIDGRPLVDVDVVVAASKVTSLQTLLPFFDTMMSKKRSLLLVVPDVDDEVVATFIVNHTREIAQMVVVVAPGFGRNKEGLLRDLSVVVGAEDRSAGFSNRGAAEEFTSFWIGHAAQATVADTEVVITHGAGSRRNVESYFRELVDGTPESGTTDPVDWLGAPGLRDRIARIERYLQSA